ncbi:C-type lectin domain family 4 member M-like isoform X2 [Neocloeon triangulifer]|uniref:C-type lectin domain family 4 member M-like isoform X2 n=1 Tax=Neocloeon triangulifer TaxID=2078957 RepID=UPI00286F153E|nr:C-type lectin domain family 4 member M-like isoform X2 [Neocloeon triangulifer]
MSKFDNKKQAIWLLLGFAAVFNWVIADGQSIEYTIKYASDRAALQQIADEMKELIQISDQRREQEAKENSRLRSTDGRAQAIEFEGLGGVSQIQVTRMMWQVVNATWQRQEQLEKRLQKDTERELKCSSDIKTLQQQVFNLTNRTEELELQNQEDLERDEKCSSEIGALQQQVSTLIKEHEEFKLRNQEQENLHETNQRLLELPKTTEQETQNDTSVNCTLARSTKLKTISNGKKYFFSNPSATVWTDANDWCENRGLHLATLKNQTDLDAVHQRAKNISSLFSWWVSARNEGSDDEPDYRWRDGSKVEDDLLALNSNKTSGCFGINTKHNRSLYPVDCNVNLYFICELPIECY